MRVEMGTLRVLMFGVMVAVAGYFMTFQVGKLFQARARASEEWPSTEGRVESSEVVSDRPTGGTNRYSPAVTYTYEANGDPYQSSMVAFGGAGVAPTPDAASEVVSRYPAGSEVRVYYNPLQPEMAVLEPGASDSASLLQKVGWALMGVGGLIALGTLLKMLLTK